jgi:hypothetical protein
MQQAARSEENLGTVGIGQIIEVWSWSILTDLFGDLPFREAFRPQEITNPSYTEQAVVYDSLFSILGQARQNLDQGNRAAVSSEDLLYGGDFSKWKSLAWALEARLHTNLTESGFSAGLENGSGRQARAQAALNAAQNAFPNGNEDIPSFSFPGGTDKENPWFQFTIQGVWTTDYQLSEFYVGLLKEQEDPRLAVQARQTGAIDATETPPTIPPDLVPSHSILPRTSILRIARTWVMKTEQTPWLRRVSLPSARTTAQTMRQSSG